jgi:hypothetical protein
VPALHIAAAADKHYSLGVRINFPAFEGHTMQLSLLSLALCLLASDTSFAQTAPKRPSLPTAATAAQSVDNTAAIAALRSEQEAVQQRIVLAEAEDQKYTGGLIKAQIQSRLAVLRLSDALLVQKLVALQTGAKVVLEAAGSKIEPSVAASLDSEAATLRLKIEQARIEADKYTGGLIKAQRESTIATMESTLAMIEQRALTAKYGLSPIPVGTPSVASATAAATTRQATVPSKAMAQDEILSLRLLDKRFVNQKYQDYVFFDIQFTADKLQKPARAIKGTLNINDLFGTRQLGISWTLDKPINPGESVVEAGQGFKYNQFTDKHQWVRSTDRANMAVTYTVESILYQDGTREDF